MAKLFASRPDGDRLNAVRIHGGYGYSTEFDVEAISGTPADDRR